MKIRVLIACLLLGSACFGQRTYQTLFLGNSYTGVNDLPSIVQSLTLAGGDTLIKDVNSPGGYTFQGHSTNSTSLAMINARQWDFVVLQEQSQIPSFPQSQVQQDCYPYAAILNDSIKENDSCTVTVFYMTWGRKFGDASNCGFWPPVCTYAGMQAELRMSYLNLANQNDALVAPCGSAWWEAIKRDSLLELYQPDQSHPSYAGSYLNGCVFYATMYRRSPIGLNFFGGLDTTTARFLQQVAHDVVFDSLTLWRVGLDDAHADWTWVSDFSGVTNFMNMSDNATHYHWDFGDGSSDTVMSPIHNYMANGLYAVTLIVSNGCTSDTLTDSIEIILVNRTDPAAANIAISPNPSKGIVMLEGAWENAESLRLNVYDLNGREVHAEQIDTPNGKVATRLDLQALSKGMYWVRLGNETAQWTRRIVLQ
jgi:hypothetical protein